LKEEDLMIDKAQLLDLLMTAVGKELERAKCAQRSSQKDAIEAEGAMMSRYDSLKEEAQYLAGAQKLRHISIEHGLTELDRMVKNLAAGPQERALLGAVVELLVDGEQRTLFFAPYGGGTVLKVEDRDVTILTPQAPLARLVWGKEAGEEFSAKIGDKHCEIYIQSVH